jgi:adenosylmethionine-8-amino-7-oxononanoate aminotransferase
VQRVIRDENLVERVRVMGDYLGKRLQDRLLPLPYVGDVRGRGLFWAVEFVLDKRSKAPFPRSLELHARMHARGMRKGHEIALFNANGGYDGYAGDHFLICPPFIVTEKDIDDIVDRTARVIVGTFDELAGSAAWEKAALEVELAQAASVADVDLGESELISSAS